jgi:hypothetical protein
MAVIEIARIQVRRGQENQTGIPQLAGGEFAWAEDTENLYIGLKREDGGARDANVRVLTENDLRLFSSFVSSTSLNANYTWELNSSDTVTSTDPVPDYTNRTIRTAQDKLDDFVSIADFGVVTTSSTAVDCTTAIQKAVDHLFLNMDIDDGTVFDTSGDLRYNKKLYIPAGHYRISDTIYIPKNTVIVGEGIDKTIIENVGLGSGIFQTVDWKNRQATLDKDGNPALRGSLGKFDPLTDSSANTIQGTGQPANIHIEGMTLMYSTSTALTPHLSLLSLDCVDHGVVRNVKFQGHHSYVTPADEDYTGIDIRGYSAVTSENILIDNCQFTGLYYCVKSNWDTNHIIIQNNSFKYSAYGVAFLSEYNSLALTGPTYSRVERNKFEEIEYQGFLVGTSATGAPAYNVSQNNSYIRVGNYGRATESYTDGTSVIRFETAGNSSVNDFFNRQKWHDETRGATDTYYPLIEGRTTVDLNSVSTSTLIANTSTALIRLPITGYPQHLDIKYRASSGNGAINRFGNLKILVRGGTTPANVKIYDEYNSSPSDGGLYWSVTVEPAYKYYELSGINPLLANPDVIVEMQTKLML